MVAERAEEILDNPTQKVRGEIIDLQTRAVLDEGIIVNSKLPIIEHHDTQEIQEGIDSEKIFLEGMVRKYGDCLQHGLQEASIRLGNVDVRFGYDRNKSEGGLSEDSYNKYQSKRTQLIGITAMETLISTGIQIQDRRNPDEMTHTAGIMFERLQELYSKDPEELHIMADTLNDTLNQQSLQERFQA